MKELMFRAWEKNMNAMIPVENIDFLAKQINTNSVWRMFHEIELMQYIGLKDKNGVEIYEGDIVEYELFGREKKMTIEYNQESASFKYCIADEIKFTIDGGNNERRAVIGNIYENPELLEVK